MGADVGGDDAFTALPALTIYDDLSSAGQDAIFASCGGLSCDLAGLLGRGCRSANGAVLHGVARPVRHQPVHRPVGGLLALAGAYQFTPLKAACLSKCRAPMMFFLQHWDEGPWRNGLRLGAVCLGCCWALMLLAFVGGVMNLAFMGLATVLMALEKLPMLGRWLTRPMGVGLLAAAALTLATGS